MANCFMEGTTAEVEEYYLKATVGLHLQKVVASVQ